MPGHVTIHRDGGWTIELVHPIKAPYNINSITLEPPDLDQQLSSDIKSNLQMVSVLSGVALEALVKLKSPDTDHVLIALMHLMPPAVREVVAQRPLIYKEPPPKEAEPPGEVSRDEAAVVVRGDPLPEPPPAMDGQVSWHDPVDPRFPQHVDIDAERRATVPPAPPPMPRQQDNPPPEIFPPRVPRDERGPDVGDLGLRPAPVTRLKVG